MAVTQRTTRIVCPERAAAGDIVTIKTLIQHPMETGFRRNDTGGPIARDIIERFTVTYGGVEVFRATLFPGIAANPYFQFTTLATATGTLEFVWVDQHGVTTRETRTLTVG